MAVGSLLLWRRVSDRWARVQFQMPPKTYRVNVVYLLVKSVVLKVPWSVTSSLPWVLFLEKNSLPFRDISKLWRWTIDGAAIYRLMRQKSDSCYLINRPHRSGVTCPPCLKPFTGLGLPSGIRQQQQQQQILHKLFDIY